ncbi:hypothetical protein DXC92_17395 [Clostridiales bacterium TF09-2AC]|nr:hypothetical protein DXC92_17395 [Clostridiales bacterium TF09-2AC]
MFYCWLFSMTCCNCARQSNKIKPVIGNFDLPEPDLLGEWLGSYEQNGILRDKISGSLILIAGNRGYGKIIIRGR